MEEQNVEKNNICPVCGNGGTDRCPVCGWDFTGDITSFPTITSLDEEQARVWKECSGVKLMRNISADGDTATEEERAEKQKKAKDRSIETETNDNKIYFIGKLIWYVGICFEGTECWGWFIANCLGSKSVSQVGYPLELYQKYPLICFVLFVLTAGAFLISCLFTMTKKRIWKIPVNIFLVFVCVVIADGLLQRIFKEGNYSAVMEETVRMSHVPFFWFTDFERMKPHTIQYVLWLLAICLLPVLSTRKLVGTRNVTKKTVFCAGYCWLAATALFAVGIWFRGYYMVDSFLWMYFVIAVSAAVQMISYCILKKKSDKKIFSILAGQACSGMICGIMDQSAISAWFGICVQTIPAFAVWFVCSQLLAFGEICENKKCLSEKKEQKSLKITNAFCIVAGSLVIPAFNDWGFQLGAWMNQMKLADERVGIYWMNVSKGVVIGLGMGICIGFIIAIADLDNKGYTAENGSGAYRRLVRWTAFFYILVVMVEVLMFLVWKILYEYLAAGSLLNSFGMGNLWYQAFMEAFVVANFVTGYYLYRKQMASDQKSVSL